MVKNNYHNQNQLGRACIFLGIVEYIRSLAMIDQSI